MRIQAANDLGAGLDQSDSDDGDDDEEAAYKKQLKFEAGLDDISLEDAHNQSITAFAKLSASKKVGMPCCRFFM